MSINAGSVYAELILKAESFFETLNQADREMSTLEKNFKNYGDKMEQAGKAWSTKVSAPIAGVGIIATKLGLDFESAMSEVGAISGATGDELIILEKKARDMGATTKFSASDAADALKYMAMAGWETHAMLDGIEGIMALAAASGEDLGAVSDIVTDALTAFGLQAKDAGHFADVLAMASSSSNTNVGLMGETFKYAAPLAGALGFTIEDTALAIGLMANAGIKGSQAGTALRQIFAEMTGPMMLVGDAFDEYIIQVENADGSMRDLREIMEELRDVWPLLTEAEQAHNAELNVGKNAMSGFLAIMNASEEDFNKLTHNINNATGAAKNMSDMMQDNLKGRWEEFKSALEEVSLQIYDLLLPSLEKWLAKGQAFIDWFSGLDEGTKKTIVNIAGMVAAVGPLLIVGGKVSNGLGSIIGLFTKFSGGAKVASVATGGLTTPMWALGGATKASTLLFNPWVLGAAAVGVGAVALAKYLRQDAIPAFELFDETISETTKEALGSFLELEKEATVSLKTLEITGREVSEEFYDSFTTNTNQMVDEVLEKLHEQRDEGLKVLEEYLGRQTEMTIEEKEEALRIATEKFDNEIKTTEEGKQRIEEILREAKETNRTITEEERIEIENILENLKKTSIEIMTESQEEQEKILENLKNNAARLTAEMMLEVIANSREQKERTIEEAEEQYEKVLDAAERLKNDGTAESIELADNMIAEAKRQKEETIAEAEEMHEKVLSELKSQGEDIYNQLDVDNEKIKTQWQKLKDWFANNPIIRRIITAVDKSATNHSFADTPQAPSNSHFPDMPQYARGTSFHPGGLAWVGEQGPEIVDLPRGSKVYTAQQSEKMVKGAGGGITQNITINSPTPLTPSEIARKNLQASRQLAMEWGV